MDEIQLVFDRTDRRYQFGDIITGRVVINPAYEFTCDEIGISYQWRTHGRGDRDKGGEGGLSLANEVSIHKGECREFPFRFEAPMGPVTYHGHELNVDWYLTASASRPFPLEFKCEEDFLLFGGEPVGPLMLGNKQIDRNELPLSSPPEMPHMLGLQELNTGGPVPQSEWTKIRNGLGLVWLLTIIGACLWAVFEHGPAAVWIYAIAATVISIVTLVILQNAYKTKLHVSEPSVEPGMVYAGGHVNCRLDFSVKRDVHLQSIEASIRANELVTFSQGTSSTTKMYVLSNKGFVKTFDEQLSSGRSISFECSLPVPADAPASFKSAHNAVEWCVDLRVNLRRWPGLARRVQITVLPAGYKLSV